MKLSLIIRSGILLVCLAGFWACSDTGLEELDRPGTGEIRDKVVLAYLSGDNNLDSQLAGNVRQMAEGMKGLDEHLVIYMDGNGLPCLMTVGKSGVLDTVKVYEEMNSSSPTVVRKVIGDMMAVFPARTYGLILSSHGLGWIPVWQNASLATSLFEWSGTEHMPITKTFGLDRNPGNIGAEDRTKTDIRQLAEALPDNKFDFILFDACHMASIEVMYEFRDKADYIVASPAEIMGDGFPYKEVTPCLWGGEKGLSEACRRFIEYYRHHPVLSSRNATVVLARMAGMDKVALESRNILSGRYDKIYHSDCRGVWLYPTIYTPDDIFVDFREYLRHVGNAAQLEDFGKALDELVVYRQATETYNNSRIPPEKFSGISTHIPQQEWSRYDAYYRQLSWTRTVYQL